MVSLGHLQCKCRHRVPQPDGHILPTNHRATSSSLDWFASAECQNLGMRSQAHEVSSSQTCFAEGHAGSISHLGPALCGDRVVELSGLWPSTPKPVRLQPSKPLIYQKDLQENRLLLMGVKQEGVRELCDVTDLVLQQHNETSSFEQSWWALSTPACLWC